MTVTRPTQSTDEYGDSIETEIPLGFAYAMIQPIPLISQEGAILNAVQMQQEVTHQVVMHYKKDLHTQDRLTLGDRVFEVVAVADINNEHRRMELLCRERT